MSKPRKTLAEVRKEAQDKGFVQGYQQVMVNAQSTHMHHKQEADLAMLQAATELMKQAASAMSKAGYLAMAVKKGNTNF